MSPRNKGANALKEDVVLFPLNDIQIVDFGINKLKQEMNVQEILWQLDKFSFDDPVQRNANVWDDETSSLLIHSILMKLPVPNIYVQLIDGKYNVIDGKQRLKTSILRFVNNEYPLHKNTPPVSIKTADGETIDYPIRSKIFKALPAEFQNRIMSHMIVFEVLNMNDEIKNVVFSRLNRSVPLKPIEKLRAELDEESNMFLKAMSQSKFIQFINIPKKTLNRQADFEVILQSMLFIAKNGETGIGLDEAKKWANGSLSKDAIEAFKAAIGYLNEVVEYLDEKEIKIQLKKNHVPMVCLVSLKAKSITPENFAQWIVDFFQTRINETNYKEFVKGGVASKENASARYRIMQKDFNKTFDLSE